MYLLRFLLLNIVGQKIHPLFSAFKHSRGETGHFSDNTRIFMRLSTNAMRSIKNIVKICICKILSVSRTHPGTHVHIMTKVIFGPGTKMLKLC